MRLLVSTYAGLFVFESGNFELVQSGFGSYYGLADTGSRILVATSGHVCGRTNREEEQILEFDRQTLGFLGVWYRSPELLSVHGLLWAPDQESLYVANTNRNQVWRLKASDEPDETVTVAGVYGKPPDTNHFNGLSWIDGRLYVCAHNHRRPSQIHILNSDLSPDRILEDVGRQVHNVWKEGPFLSIVSSAERSVYCFDPARRERRQVLQVDGYPRGFAAVDSEAHYVGVSHQAAVDVRNLHPSRLLRCDRNWQVVDSWELPLPGVERVSDFTEKDGALCVSRTRPFEHHETADVEVLTENGSRLEAIRDLQETAWDDHEAILLNGGPVDRKSPGQRSSAMLPLIALAQTTPLVIDQPEDNVDKRLIGTVLMNVLAVLKEKRQIIVCTHDANILVGGDAEQVVVLEAESDRKGKVGQHGSIDNDDIVETVVNLLEGGAEAFEARRKRYKGHAGISE